MKSGEIKLMKELDRWDTECYLSDSMQNEYEGEMKDGGWNKLGG